MKIADAKATSDKKPRPTNGLSLVEMCLGRTPQGQMAQGKCVTTVSTTTTTLYSLVAACDTRAGTYHELKCTVANNVVLTAAQTCAADDKLLESNMCAHAVTTTAPATLELGGMCAAVRGSVSTEGVFCILPNGLPKPL